MGTNYYLVPAANPCPTCGHDGSRDLHVGKSSAGWVFAWRGYRSDEWNPTPAGRDLTSPSDWFDFLAEQVEAGKVIRDEYDREISLDDFRSRVEAKRRGRPGFPAMRSELYEDGVEHVEGDDVLFHEFS